MRRPALVATSLALFVVATLGLWEVICLLGFVQSYILPTPFQVFLQALTDLQAGDLQANTGTTLEEAGFGFALSACIAFPFGYALAKMPTLEIFAFPYIATSQTVPVIAIAPIIILLFGTGITPKILIAAVLVLFPLLTTIVTGLRQIDSDYLDAARIGASRLRTLLVVEIPLASPTILNGIKRGLILAITGATVGEFLSGNSGLGFMISTAQQQFQATQSFVALLTLILIGVICVGSMTFLERTALVWLDY